MVRILDPRRAEWKSHPLSPVVKVAELLNTRNARIYLVEVPEGGSVPEHKHQNERDTAYVLEGEAVFWVEGLGEIVVGEGKAISIEPGKQHALRKVTGRTLILDIFTRE